MEKEFETKGGFITYRENEDDVTITGYRGRILEAVIPETLQGKIVTEIAKKAFLGCKSLCRAEVSKTCQRIGEWAFASCSHLETIVLPRTVIDFGQGCFRQNDALSQIVIPGAEETSCLLAAAVTQLDAAYFLRPEETGTREWIGKWDLAMNAFLNEADEEGYQKMVLCGEEDLSASLDDFLAEKRRKKARLCLLRLLNPKGLTKERKQELESFLQNHTKGCESEAAWEVVLWEHGEEKPYFELFTSLGCVTEENFEAILADFGDRHAQMKSYLMEYHDDGIRTQDFFDSLSL